METRLGQRLRAKVTGAFRLPGAVLCLLALSLGLGACGRKIGDACSSSADCDPTSGTRTCDLSQPGGYCLLEGCDARSCPSESVCVRFFPEALLMPTSTNACNPASALPSCAPDQFCVPISCADGDQGCMGGICARLSWEKRDCVQSCGGNGDCRGGYTCQKTGTGGTVALTLTPGNTPSFCAPTPK